MVPDGDRCGQSKLKKAEHEADRQMDRRRRARVRNEESKTAAAAWEGGGGAHPPTR